MDKILVSTKRIESRDKWRRLLLRLLSLAATIACIALILPSTNFTDIIVEKFSGRKYTRARMFNLRIINDKNYFTNEEYEELMKSYLRKQSFDNASVKLATTTADLEEPFFELVEGRNDYLTTNREFSYFDDAESSISDIASKQTCEKPVQNILFLKTHNTGSDVATNIFNRFADLRQLLVAQPTNGLSSFYWPNKFHWRYMDMQRLDGNLPNMLCNYARYNAKVMTQFMPASTRFVSMLRDPLDHFVSVFEQLNIGKRFLEMKPEKSLRTFVLNAKVFLQQAIRKGQFYDSMNLLKNGMFFDLGLPTAEYENEVAITNAILDLHNRFTIVLIYEYLDESLVLMKRKLCWDTDDVIYFSTMIPLKERQREYPREVEEGMKKWNKADFKLYEFFNATLWEEIAKEENFPIEVSKFKARRREIEKQCTKGSVAAQNATFHFANEIRTHKRLGLMDICRKMKMDDQEYLEHFQRLA